MLISFSVENFRSIRDLQTLSLEARSGEHLAWSHTAEAGKRQLLKSAAIYGANASGKSNVIAAMIWFREFVLNSSKEGQASEPIKVQPFRLSSETESAPTHFEVEFFWNEFEYRYGFEVTGARVESEWLFRKTPGAKPARLFTRDGDGIHLLAKFKEGKGLEGRTRENALFLSVCAQFNGDIATDLLGWMRRFRHVTGVTDHGILSFTAGRLGEAEHQEKLVELAQKADLNIRSMATEPERFDESKLPPKIPDALRKLILSEDLIKIGITTTHDKVNADGQVVGTVEFDLQSDESQGTQRFVALSGPLTHTLEEGSILVVDEMDARLHPRLTQAIVDLFHSPVNRNNAQLIFATHDVALMDPERFRRDQVWFCEKDRHGATDLYSLADFDPNQVRPTSKFSRQYLLGLFGAVPKLAHFEEAAADATAE